jgi:alkaline phosphatase
MKKKILSVIITIGMVILVYASGVQETAPDTVSKDQNGNIKAKNIILLIGDGMATAQIETADAYLGAQKGIMLEHLCFESFPYQGLTTTYANDRFITDSAAAGTAIATGHKTYCGAISVNEEHKSLKTILEYAQDKGKATGIITTTRVTHATPAVFLSHNKDRDAENEIALDESTSNVDFLAGGGYRNFIGQNNTSNLKSKRTDNLDLIENMKKAGYTAFISEDQTAAFNNYVPKKGEKIVGLFGSSHLDYAIDQANQPTLAQMTSKGLELLSKDTDGFFMMVEGGRIDHACHANDATSAIIDTLAFNDAVQVAIDFYNKNPEDTLIIVTGDHETGGLTLGFAGTYYESAFDKLEKQNISYENYETGLFKSYKDSHDINSANLHDLRSDLSKYFGLDKLTVDEELALSDALKRSVSGEVIKGSSEADYLLYGGYEPFIMQVTHIVNNRAGVAWTSYSHTAVPVATFAMGPDSNQVNGMFDNTRVFDFMANAFSVVY